MRSSFTRMPFAIKYGAVLMLAFAVRLLGIQSRPIWYDEAFAILFARKGLSAMLYGTLAPDALGSAADIHPLGYYSLLWGWMKIFGETVPAARMLSILVGMFSVSLVILFLAKYFREDTALLGGVFVAVAPFPVHYSQEIRMYGLLSLWLIAATYFFWRAAGLTGKTHANRTRLDWFFFAVFAAFAQYTHNLAVFFLVSLAFIPVFQRNWQNVKNTLYAGCFALMIYLPWLLQIPGQLSKVGTSYWTTRPDSSRIISTLLTYVNNLPIPDRWLPFALFVSLLTLTLAAWQSFASIESKKQIFESGAIWLLYMAFAPAFLMFIFSLWMPVYLERALLPSGIFYLLWVAWAFVETRIPKIIQQSAISILLIAMVMGLYQHLMYTGFPYAPFHKINHAIQSNLTEDTVVLHSNKLSALPAFLDDPSLPIRYLADPPGSGSDTLAIPTQQVIGLMAEDTLEAVVKDYRHIFLVIYEKELFERQEISQLDSPLHQLEDSGYSIMSSSDWGDLLVYEYQLP